MVALQTTGLGTSIWRINSARKTARNQIRGLWPMPEAEIEFDKEKKHHEIRLRADFVCYGLHVAACPCSGEDQTKH
jgi:hypothetical protein